jgi:hypothetical protein
MTLAVQSSLESSAQPRKSYRDAEEEYQEMTFVTRHFGKG